MLHMPWHEHVQLWQQSLRKERRAGASKVMPRAPCFSAFVFVKPGIWGCARQDKAKLSDVFEMKSEHRPLRTEWTIAQMCVPQELSEVQAQRLNIFSSFFMFFTCIAFNPFRDWHYRATTKAMGFHFWPFVNISVISYAPRCRAHM